MSPYLQSLTSQMLANMISEQGDNSQKYGVFLNKRILNINSTLISAKIASTNLRLGNLIKQTLSEAVSKQLRSLLKHFSTSKNYFWIEASPKTSPDRQVAAMTVIFVSNLNMLQSTNPYSTTQTELVSSTSCSTQVPLTGQCTSSRSLYRAYLTFLSIMLKNLKFSIRTLSSC